MEGLETLTAMKSLWLGKNKIEEICGGKKTHLHYPKGQCLIKVNGLIIITQI